MSWLSRPRSHSCFLLEHMTQQLIFKGCRVEKLQPKYILMAFFRGTERKEKLRLHSGKLIIRTRNNPVVNTLRGFWKYFDILMSIFLSCCITKMSKSWFPWSHTCPRCLAIRPMSSTFLKLLLTTQNIKGNKLANSLGQSKAKQKKECQNEPTILLFGHNHKLEEAMWLKW